MVLTVLQKQKTLICDEEEVDVNDDDNHRNALSWNFWKIKLLPYLNDSDTFILTIFLLIRTSTHTNCIKVPSAKLDLFGQKQKWQH